MIMAKDSNNNYVKIEDIKQQNSFNGVSPIKFKGSGENLENYRIYGNTIGGESVGDRTGNLFDGSFLQGYWAYANGSFTYVNTWICTTKIPCTGGRTYTYSFSNVSRWTGFVWYDADGNYISTNNLQDPSATPYRLYSAMAPSNAAFMVVNIAGYPYTDSVILPSDITDFMLVEGSTALPYEPYGYKMPVTVEGKNLFDKNSQSVPGFINNDGDISAATYPTSTYDFISVDASAAYTYRAFNVQDTSSSSVNLRVAFYNSDKAFVSRYVKLDVTLSGNTITTPDDCQYIRLSVDDNLTDLMFIEGATIPTNYEPYRAPVTTPIYLPEQLKMVGDKAEYVDYKEQKQHFADGTSADVELPALPTLSGTNTLSVGTEIKPSKVWGRLSDPRDIEYVKDNLGNILFSKYHEVEDEPPLTFKAKKEGALKDYRIYGNTVSGESVGDLMETGEHAGEYRVPVTVEGKNLFDGEIGVDNEIIGETGGTTLNNEYAISEYIPVEPNMSYTYHFYHNNIVENRKTYSITEYDRNKNIIHPMTLQHITEKRDYVIIFTTRSDTAYIRINWKKPYDEDLMLNEGSTPLPYEPYHAPITTPIYLPEPIKMVGSEAEYVDYGAQKMHRVRKNLLKNTATNQTINGVTFTVNNDGSVTCNGTASSIAFFAIAEPVNLSKNIVSGCPRNGSSNSYLLRYQQSGGIYVEDKGNGVLISDYGDSRVIIRINAGYTCENLTFYPMIRKADITDDRYEPYIENTELDVTLPTLPTLSGTNTLSVGTEVQPSEVYIKGKIKEIN